MACRGGMARGRGVVVPQGEEFLHSCAGPRLRQPAAVATPTRSTGPGGTPGPASTRNLRDTSHPRSTPKGAAPMTHLLAEGGYQAFLLSSSEKTWLYFALVCAVAAIAVGLLLVRGVLAADQGTASMKDIAKAIQEGAEAFLARQFKTIGIIIVPLAVFIFFTATKVTHTVNHLVLVNGSPVLVHQTITDLTFAQAGTFRVICFLAGAVCSGLTGFIGMSMAVRGNVRTACLLYTS